MPKLSPTSTPSYRRHRGSGQAVVTLNGKDHNLGRYGTAASKAGYDRLIREWLACGRQLPVKGATSDLTIAELIARYLRWVRSYYRRPDGTQTKEVNGFIRALRPLNHLYGKTPAQLFGPIALEAVRDLMIHGHDHPRYGPQPALARGVINQRIKRIRRMFRWGARHELISATNLHALQTVPGLQLGRTDARETLPVEPVARAVVEDTLPLLRPMQADMVRLQLETGMRPGELVIMRPCDIDTTGPVWLYRPRTHKTQYHGHERIVPIGPKGQLIVKQYLTINTQACLFSPRQNMEERRITLRLNRKTPVQPSQRDRRKKSPKRQPGDSYTTDQYRRSIAEAIERHNANRPESERIPHWFPHQLRHLRALELKREAGLDVARAVLGHRSPVMTEHYATLDIAKGAEVMSRIG
jgi:integrase